MHTYVLKLEPTKRFTTLHSKIYLACEVYNHFVKLCYRYYQLYEKHMKLKPRHTLSTDTFRLNNHLKRLKDTKRFSYWKQLNSQSLQDIVERITRAYKLYFTNQKKHRKSSPPKRRKRWKYYSLTYKQTGYKVNWENHLITIQGIRYKFFPPTKQLHGKIKTVTVKRTKRGEFFVFIVTDLVRKPICIHTTGKSVGVDFGLKTYLTGSDDTQVQSPLFFKQSLKRIKQLHRQLSHKQKGSKHWVESLHKLQKAYEHITYQRLDFHRKLALKLVKTYDVLCFETLNIKAMCKIWGRKVHDLGFSMFMGLLKMKAIQYGVTVVQVDRFYPSSQLCSHCGYRNSQTKDLNVRWWRCPHCGQVHDRDTNAAVNIEIEGLRMLGYPC